ncbi:MAG: HAD-IIIA family hydrolase [Clostridia bacterium]|nr:HAD-IIIA family hydrolase [Clostridia bacterium]
MFENMKPSIKCRSVYDLDLSELRSIGIRGLMFDIDNTLEPYAQEVPSEKLCRLFSELYAKGFRVALVSNAKEDRVERFCAGFPKSVFPLGIISVAQAGKPLEKGFKEACFRMGLESGQTAMIGDQIFTDIWGGNRFGAMTILVRPIAPEKEPPFVRFKRILEKLVR